MLNFILRRIQRVIIPIKVTGLVAGMATMIYLVVKTAPGLGNILFFSLLLFMTISFLLSFFISTSRSLLAGITIGFLLFLKAVGLLSPLNLGLFLVFLILLGLYLWKK